MAILANPVIGLAAENSCPWVPTLEKSPEEVAKLVEEKSGKKPTKSCGGGTDFKVCHECAQKLTPDQWRRIQWMLAEPSYRQWHFGWHGQSVTAARTQARATKGNFETIQGESFFYAHREFYRNVQANLAAMGLPCIMPWSRLPETREDANFPTIGVVLDREARPVCLKIDPSGEKLKQLQLSEDEFAVADRPIVREAEKRGEELQKLRSPTARMKLNSAIDQEVAQKRANARKNLKNKPPEVSPEDLEALQRCVDRGEKNNHERAKRDVQADNEHEFLQNNSIGAVGNAIDGNWHGPVHRLYETPQSPDCVRGSIEVGCDSMADSFSSHVNMNFYKVHGLVDEFAEKWLARHGYEIASKNCKGKEKCYEWKSTFVGRSPDFVAGTGCRLEHGPNGSIAASKARAPQPRPAPAQRTRQAR
jgi:hypothetical protein